MAHDASIGVALGRRRRPAMAREAAARLRAVVEHDALTIVVVALWTALFACSLPSLFGADSWLTFVDGRLIALHGLPRHDTLAYWTLGRRWTDQQWGAHLAFYELVRYGGPRAAGALSLACVAGAVGGAAVVARKLGASPRGAAIGALLPLVGAPWLGQVRTQTLALAPFVAVYALLSFDARRRDRRVLAVLPLLGIWANLHGSVALAVGLTTLYGLQRLRHSADRATSLVLVLGTPFTLFASPYGFDLARYYRLMLTNPALSRIDREWQPASVERSTIVFFGSALVLAALWGRHRTVLTRFERWTLPILLVASLGGVRNIVWFELAAAVSAPRLLDAAWRSQPPTAAVRKANVVVAVLGVTAALAITVAQLARPASRLEPAPAAAAAVVATAAGHIGLVLADDSHADWLLWREPSLAGRIAYDVRFELFDQREMMRLVSVQQPWSSFWRRCGSRVAVITFPDSSWRRQLVAQRVLAQDAHLIAQSPAFGALAQSPTAPACRL
ncbi:MAG: hypothetical protein ACJ76I_02220 [Gaiellaceae bacterium]